MKVRTSGRRIRALQNLLFRSAEAGLLGCLAVLPGLAGAGEEKAAANKDDRVGICTHFAQNWSVPQVMPLIAASGAGWIRDEIHWSELEPEVGVYQLPAKTRGWIQAAKNAGLKIVLALTYGNPRYADPYDPVAYAKAAAWLAQEVENDVQAIEVLNEPNNFGFRTRYGGAWNGKETDGSVSPYLQKYVQILNESASQIKQVNPRMTVIGLGAPAPANFRMIALGLIPQVDGITDHPYGGELPEYVPYADTATYLQRDGIATADHDGTFASQVEMYRAESRRMGSTTGIWHTEWGYATVRSRPNKPGLSEQTQAVYLLRRLIESEAIGVDHTFIYDMKDEGGDPYSDYGNFGLLNQNLSRKQGFFALQRITAKLAGAAPVSPEKAAALQPTAEQPWLSRCYSFRRADALIVAFWEVKPGNAQESSKAVLTLPFDHPVRQALLYNPFTGEQQHATVGVAGGRRVSVDVAVTDQPQLLTIQ